MTVSLQRTLLGLVVLILLVGLVPAGVLLDRRLLSSLEDGVRAELLAGPLVLQDRFQNQAGMRMMHALEISASEILTTAIRNADKQVLLNLVQNAQDALGPEGNIGIRVTSDGQRATLVVTDDGPGIDDAVLPDVFDPFFTTKADVRGVGLGLFTADGLARTHGGRITAGNRTDGTGAVLTVEMPLVSESEEGAGHGAEIPTQATS